MDKVTNKQLYDELQSIRKEMRGMFDGFQRDEFTPLKNRVDILWNWGIIIVAIITFGMQFLVFWLQNKIKF